MQKDSWDIDYQATLNALQAARQSGAAHFVLLSAICVQKPLLEFQRAKLKFEAAPAGTAAVHHGFDLSQSCGCKELPRVPPKKLQCNASTLKHNAATFVCHSSMANLGMCIRFL